MITARTVSKNTLALLAGSAISHGLRLVYVAALARYVGVEGIGKISTATALVSLSILIVNFGLDTLVIRDLAGDKTRAGEYLANVAFVRLLLTLAMAAVLAAVVSQSHYPREVIIIIAVYALTYVLDSFSDVARSIFHAYQRMEYAALMQCVRDAINVGASLLGIALGWSLVAIVWISAFAALIKLALSMIAVQWRFVRPALRLDPALLRQLLWAAVPFAALLSIGVLHGQLNIIILSWIDTAEAVGIYSAATFPIVTLLILPDIFMQSIFPVFSNHYQRSTMALNEAYRASYKAMLIVGFPLGAGTMLVSRHVIRLVYGPGFEQAVPVMNILALQLLTMVGYVNGAFLNATNRQTLFAVLRAAMVTFSALLCIILIPTYGYLGAAVAATIPALVDFWLYSILCHRYARLSLPWGTGLRIGASTVTMALTGYLALSLGMNVFLVALLVAPSLYIACLIGLSVIGAEERRFIGEVIPIKRSGHDTIRPAGD